MKVAVLSDTHIGRAVPRQIADLRRQAYRRAFSQAIDIAVSENAGLLLHCGDLFEKRSMTPEDSVFVKEEFQRFFDSVEKSNGEAPHVYIIRGNHDGSQEGDTIDYVRHPLAKYMTVASGPVDESTVYNDDKVCIIGIPYERYLARKLRDSTAFIKKTFDENTRKLKIIVVHGFIEGYHYIPPNAPAHTYVAMGDLEHLGSDLVISGHYHVPLDPVMVGGEHKVTFLNAGATEAENIGEGAEYGVHIIDGLRSIRFIPITPLQLIRNVTVESGGTAKPVDWYVAEAKREIEGYAQEVQEKDRDGILRMVLKGLTNGDPFTLNDFLENASLETKKTHPRLIHAEFVNDVNKIVRQVDRSPFRSGVDFAADVLQPLGVQQLADAAGIVGEVSTALDSRASKKTGLLTDSDRAPFVKKWVEVLEKANQP